MYTLPSHRGSEIGALIVERIEALARAGRHHAAGAGDRRPASGRPGRVYERAGFARCGAVLDYPDSRWSVFYRKVEARDGISMTDLTRLTIAEARGRS